MKALILSGGKGTRLYPVTYAYAKQLIPLANKPVLFYVIESIVSAGVFDIGIVVGDTSKQIEEAVGDGKIFGREVKITYIRQEQPLGLAHAVKVAQDFVGQERFIMFLGDNFIEEDIRDLVERFDAPDCSAHAQILLVKVHNPQDFGVAEVCYGNDHAAAPDIYSPAQSMHLVRVVEKPEEFISDLALVGIYFFDYHIFEAIDNIRSSPRGELEITDAIQYLIDHHYIVRSQQISGNWIDTGELQNMLDANSAILSKLPGQVAGSVSIDDASYLCGEVVIEEHARIINSIIYGPSIIGKHVILANSVIGAFTSIGRNSTVIDSSIKNSIVMDYCDICNVKKQISKSLIGSHVQIYAYDDDVNTRHLDDHSRMNMIQE